MVEEVSERSALSGRLSVSDSAPISRSRDVPAPGTAIDESSSRGYAGMSPLS